MIRPSWLPILGALALSACAHQKPIAAAAPPAPPPAVLPAAPPPAVAAAPAAATCASDLQCGGDQLCVDGTCRAITASLEACSLTRVHFDYDLAELHPDELPKLQRMARCIQATRPAHVLITGNADERGTVEYNLALGQRRAGAVEKYLVDLGVPALRLSLVTYGKEEPICTAHDEACWRLNRRSAIRPNQTAMDLRQRVKADEAREHAPAASRPAGG